MHLNDLAGKSDMEYYESNQQSEEGGNGALDNEDMVKLMHSSIETFDYLPKLTADQCPKQVQFDSRNSMIGMLK